MEKREKEKKAIKGGDRSKGWARLMQGGTYERHQLLGGVNPNPDEVLVYKKKGTQTQGHARCQYKKFTDPGPQESQGTAEKVCLSEKS